MDKTEFDELEATEQIKYVNDLLSKEQTLTLITHDLGLGRTTLTRYFKKASYIYDSTTRQYVKTTIPQEVSKDHTENNGKEHIDHKVDYVAVDKLDNRPIRRLKFSIPIKTKLKNTTKAFNVVMDKTLVERIDKMAKLKGGYSRNQIINMMCLYAIDNIDEK